MTGRDTTRPPSLLLAASIQRSGSTLVQRYITSMTDLFLWGESSHLVESLVRAYERWPARWRNEREYRRIMADPTEMERKYTPNVSPPREHLLDAFGHAIVRIYDTLPTGFTRWGWKAVRYGRAEIEFVRSVFPELQLVLLVRDPYAVARSIVRKGWLDKGFFSDVRDVATRWTDRTSYFLQLRSDPHVHFIQYEHLRAGLPELNAFIGAIDDPAKQDRILTRKLGAAPRSAAQDLARADIRAITDIAGDLAASLGYQPPE